MSYRNRTPRMAALLLSVALGGASLTMLPAADAAPRVHVASSHAKAESGPAVLKRLSVVKGVPGQMVVIQGSSLTTEGELGPVAKAVKFGETVVAGDSVLSAGPTILLVTVPAHANGAVTVTVGDAAKGLKFTYAAPITVDMDEFIGLSSSTEGLTIEKGLPGYSIEGTNFSKTTKVLVGGKPAKIAKDGVAADGKKITFDFPAGLVGVQDVLLVDAGVTVLAGFVMYQAAPVTVTAVAGTAYVEQASTVELTGTNLDLVSSVTYDGVKATFKAVKGDNTKLSVTVPKGAVKDDGLLVVTTKNGATASFEVDRVAAPIPTVTAVSTVTVSTAGEVTLTGTNLTGLKKVVVKSAAGKLVNGSKLTVATDGKSATVTLPALAAGTYTVSVTAVSATASTAFEFTVAAA